MPITVHATESDVLATLTEGLTVEELAQLRLESAADASSPFSPEPRRAEPITTATVVIWVISTVASGVAYDAAKQLAAKVRELLVTRFGAGRVKPDDDGE